MNDKTYAHLTQESLWRRVFPDGNVPIKSILPSSGNMIGGGGPQDCYIVDFERLTSAQQNAIWELMAQQRNSTAEEARRGVMEEQKGILPLRATHVASTSTDLRAFI